MKIEKCIYSVIETDKGNVFLAECERSSKVVALYFINVSLEDSLAEFHDSFETVSFYPGSPKNANLVIEAVNNLDNSIEIPCVYRCETDLFKKIYNEIKKIPRGETRTYSQIASAIGDPKAVSHVALACIQNNLAILIPCHRVIASNGKLSGYRWGAEKKLEILRAEGFHDFNHSVM